VNPIHIALEGSPSQWLHGPADPVDYAKHHPWRVSCIMAPPVFPVFGINVSSKNGYLAHLRLGFFSSLWGVHAAYVMRWGSDLISSSCQLNKRADMRRVLPLATRVPLDATRCRLHRAHPGESSSASLLKYSCTQGPPVSAPKSDSLLRKKRQPVESLRSVLPNPCGDCASFTTCQHNMQNISKTPPKDEFELIQPIDKHRTNVHGIAILSSWHQFTEHVEQVSYRKRLVAPERHAETRNDRIQPDMCSMQQHVPREARPVQLV
jgi:hypothetical protein